MQRIMSRMEKNMKKIIVLLMCVIMTTSLFICGCGKKTSKDGLKEIIFCLDWTPNTNHTGLYVALEKGYYEDAGFDVKIVQPPEGGATLMCASGQAQFAIDAQDTIAASFDLDNPIEVTAVAAILQHNTSGIISRAGEGLDTPKGLEGKTYATWDSPIEQEMIKYAMKISGGDFSKVNLIPNAITNEAAALEAKQTDAVWIYYGWSGINAEISGLDFDYWDFASITEELDYYTPIIIANNKYLKDNADDAKAFMEATKKGYEYAAENPKDAADILINGDETGSLRGCEELVYKSQEWISKQYISDAKEWGVIDETRWNKFYKWLYENKLTSNDLTGKGFSDEYLQTSN